MDKAVMLNAVKRLFFIEKDSSDTFFTVAVHTKTVCEINEVVVECSFRNAYYSKLIFRPIIVHIRPTSARSKTLDIKDKSVIDL